MEAVQTAMREVGVRMRPRVSSDFEGSVDSSSNPLELHGAGSVQTNLSQHGAGSMQTNLSQHGAGSVQTNLSHSESPTHTRLPVVDV